MIRNQVIALQTVMVYKHTEGCRGVPTMEDTMGGTVIGAMLSVLGGVEKVVVALRILSYIPVAEAQWLESWVV